MDGVRLSGGAAVRPQAFVDASHVLPSRSGATDTATLQLHLPSSTKPSQNSVSSVRKLKRDVPARYAPKRPPRVAVSSEESDLKKLSRRRARGRVATVETVDPDVDAGGLLKESLHARLEEAYRRPSFATLMSDFEAKLGGSILEDEDIYSSFGLDSGGSTVLQSNAEETLLDDASLLSTPGKISRSSKSADLNLNGEKASSSISAPKAVKKRGPGQRPNVEGNRILKITKNPVTRRLRKVAVTLSEPKEIVTQESEEPVAETVAERGGKRRLSLRSRIAMKQCKQGSGVNHNGVVHPETLSPEDRELWSEEIEDLINKYSSSLDLTAPLWDHLDRGLLSAAEENRLAIYMKPMKVSSMVPNNK